MLCAVIFQNMVSYDIDDKYCPCGNSWIRVPNSTLFSDCYYCPHCDKIFQPTVKEVTKKWFSENFSSDRFQQIKNLALIVDARKKVSKEDLVKLGLYNGT